MALYGKRDHCCRYGIPRSGVTIRLQYIASGTIRIANDAFGGNDTEVAITMLEIYTDKGFITIPHTDIEINLWIDRATNELVITRQNDASVRPKVETPATTTKYPDGVVKTWHKFDGEVLVSANTYHCSGFVESKSKYSNNEVINHSVYNHAGVMITSFTRDDKTCVETRCKYNSNGSLAFKHSYVNGILNGKQCIFDSIGKLVSTKQYNMGELVESSEHA